MHFLDDKLYVAMHINIQSKSFQTYFCTLNSFLCLVSRCCLEKADDDNYFMFEVIKKGKMNETVEENKLFKIYLNEFSLC